MSLLRDTIYAAVILATSPVWGYRLLRTGKWRTDWSGRFGRCDTSQGDDRTTILLHAVSVGEVNAIAKLVDVLHQRSGSNVKIVVSTTTDTGQARARHLFEPTHQVVRYPIDIGYCVKRFLNAIKPDLVALAELEVWPTFVDECTRRNVPVCVINGRLSERSFRWYRRIAALVRPAFSKLAAVATQTPQYARRFVAMGVPNERVNVIDSMKWDTAARLPEDQMEGHPPQCDDVAMAGVQELASAMGIEPSRPIIVAGSTGPGEEQMLIEQCPTKAQLVLAPRKPERFDQVAALDDRMVRRSQHGHPTTAVDRKPQFFLLDTIGELTKAYCLADIAIVGRSFLGLHGSNPLEPIALGKPTIIGPHHDDFADIVEVLQNADGIVVTDRPCQAADELLADPPRRRTLAQRGLDAILARQGATEKHADLLLRLLRARPAGYWPDAVGQRDGPQTVGQEGLS